MNPDPVTAAEIAAILRDIRTISDNPSTTPAVRASALARKADLLARIADQRTHEWTCEHAHQARQVARQARDTAAQAHLITDDTEG